MKKNLPKVLIRSVNWLGDAVMSLPAIFEIKRLFPEYQLIMYTPSHLKDIYKFLPFETDIIEFEKPRNSKGYFQELSKIKYIKNSNFELSFIFPLSIHSALIPFLAGIPVRIGYKRNIRSIFLTHSFNQRSNFKTEKHQSFYYLDLVSQFTKKEAKFTIPQLNIPDAEKQNILKKLEEKGFKNTYIVGIAPGAEYGPAKRWPLKHWHLLISHILHNTNFTIVITGTIKEKNAATFLKGKEKNRIIDLTGELSLKEFLAFLSLCTAFISNDSGAMHAASICGAKTIGIFGSTSPAATSPIGKRKTIIYKNYECSPCFQRKCPFNHYKCLEEITPKEVFETLTNIL